MVVPYEKDYDQLEPPTRWAKQWDLANWTIIAAYSPEGDKRLGGAVLAHRTPGVYMLRDATISQPCGTSASIRTPAGTVSATCCSRQPHMKPDSGTVDG